MLRFDRASVILCLDADPLLTDPEMIRHARGFAAGRRAGASGGAMNRLYAVEGVYSLTGAMADHRLRLESRQIAAVPRGARRAPAPPRGRSRRSRGAAVAGIDARWIDALAKDLLANRGKGLIVAGERQPAGRSRRGLRAEHALGNTGTTVSYHETKDAALPSLSSLAVAGLRDERRAPFRRSSSSAAIRSSMRPPISISPRRMAKVPHVDRARAHRRRNLAKAEWYIPRAHYLESWGDARAVGGTLSVVQPLILPLFGGRRRSKCWG